MKASLRVVILCVCLTLDCDYMCSKTNFTHEKNHSHPNTTTILPNCLSLTVFYGSPRTPLTLWWHLFPDIFTLFSFFCNWIYMKGILHMVPIKNIMSKSSYDRFNVDMFRLLHFADCCCFCVLWIFSGGSWLSANVTRFDRAPPCTPYFAVGKQKIYQHQALLLFWSKYSKYQ